MNPREHLHWPIVEEWFRAALAGEADLAIDLLIASLVRPEAFADTPFAELPAAAADLVFILDQPEEAIAGSLAGLGESVLSVLELLSASEMAAGFAREIIASPAASAPTTADQPEAPLPPIAGEVTPASPLEAAPILAGRFAEELAAWDVKRVRRERPTRLRERLRLASSALRRAGYRTFGTLASDLDATLDEQIRSEALPPDSLFPILHECAELMAAMAARDFPKHRTHYAICARLEGVRREIAKAGEQALAARRAAVPKRQAKVSRPTLSQSKHKLSELEELFLGEMEEHLDDMTRQLLLAESNPSNHEAINALMRSAHSIKGSAAITGFREISRLGHAMEDLMVLVRDERLPVSSSIAQIVFRGVDRLRALKDDAEQGKPATTERTDQLIARLNVLTTQVSENMELYRRADGAPAPDQSSEDELPEEEHRTAAAAKVISVDVRHLDRLMNIAADLVIGRTRLTAQLAASAHLQDKIDRGLNELGQSGLRLKRALELERTPAATSSSRRTQGEFEASELDQFDESDLIARDLRESIARVQDEAENLHAATREFDTRLTFLAGLITDLRESVRRARLLPIGQVFDRFPRALRDLSQKLGRPLALKIAGETTLLDKQVLDQLADPLMHLLRNAADHGIESREERLRTGKPAQGTIRLSARQAGGQAVIEVSDDGAGINVERVREKAVQRGMMSAEDAAGAKDEELYALLLKSGFSTAAAVTDVSGRGVGLDVVAKTVEELKGSITIHSRPGKGTTFIVRLPVSLAIAQGLLVKLGDETYAIPIDAVEEVVLLDPNHVRAIVGRPVYVLRGRPIPLLDLRSHFGVAAPRAPGADGPYVLVAGDARAATGLVIDSIAGIEEFVQKGFGEYLNTVEYMAGATVLADGRVTLILDAIQLGAALAPVQSELAALESRVAETEEIETLLEDSPAASEEAPYDRGVRAGAHPALDALPEVSTSAAEQPRAPVSHAAPHILAVDDSVSVRRYVAGILEHAGFEVTMAVDGIDALDKLAHDTFDLILTDLEMPRMHGFELITEIKATPNLRKLPIVILTGRMGEKHSRKGLELGAAAYLVKPFEETALVSTIRDVLNRKDDPANGW